jgi:hypothetical protein
MPPWASDKGAEEEPTVSTDMAREVAGKKFMWDGAVYSTRDDAREAMEGYKKDGFEVHMFLEQDRYLVYTRRLVTQ